MRTGVAGKIAARSPFTERSASECCCAVRSKGLAVRYGRTFVFPLQCAFHPGRTKACARIHCRVVCRVSWSYLVRWRDRTREGALSGPERGADSARRLFGTDGRERCSARASRTSARDRMQGLRKAQRLRKKCPAMRSGRCGPGDSAREIRPGRYDLGDAASRRFGDPGSRIEPRQASSITSPVSVSTNR